MTSRSQDLRRALLLSAISIGWSGIAGSIAVYVAVVSGSLSLLGFGVDAVIDAIASVTLIWRFMAESTQPHRAALVERRAERIIGWALMALALYLAVASLRSLASATHPQGSDVGLVLLVASVIVLPGLALAKNRVARRLGSGSLRADSVLTAVAALLAAISLASLALADLLGFWWADAIAALVVAAILLKEGWSSARAGALEVATPEAPHRT
jgi:divalent metal cation (Fe/Co/Zn/Cd) transporter